MLFTPSFLRHCDALSEVARRAWGRRFLHRRIDRGVLAGTEATGQVDYTAGHDLRYVDWNRCARHDELVTRLYHGREDHQVLLLVDVSRSMAPGGSEKFARTRELAAELGYLALTGGDTLTVASFAAGLKEVAPPLRGRAGLPALGRFLEQLQPTSGGTDLRQAAADFPARSPRWPQQGVVISDLAAENWEQGVEAWRRRIGELHLVQVYSAEEADPELAGAVSLVDAESQQSLSEELDLDDLRRYREVFREFLAGVRQYCRRYEVGLTQISTATRADLALQELLRR